MLHYNNQSAGGALQGGARVRTLIRGRLHVKSKGIIFMLLGGLSGSRNRGIVESFENCEPGILFYTSLLSDESQSEEEQPTAKKKAKRAQVAASSDDSTKPPPKPKALAAGARRRGQSRSPPPRRRALRRRRQRCRSAWGRQRRRRRRRRRRRARARARERERERERRRRRWRRCPRRRRRSPRRPRWQPPRQRAALRTASGPHTPVLPMAGAKNCTSARPHTLSFLRCLACCLASTPFRRHGMLLQQGN